MLGSGLNRINEFIPFYKIIQIKNKKNEANSQQASINVNRQTERRKFLMKDEYLTARWNNILTLGLGAVMLIYAAIFFSTTILSDFAAFLGLAIIAALY
jgi:hypothetical protein